MSAPTARHTDHITAHEAAAFAAHRAPTHRILALLAHHEHWKEGLTDFDLEAVTGIKQTSIGCRRKGLVDEGLVTALRSRDGDLIKRPAPSGVPVQVWGITWAGFEVAVAERRRGA